MRIELLYFDGCPGYAALLPALRELLAAEGIENEIELRRVETPEDAEREHFLGSPTLRVGSKDVDSGASEREDYGVKCRLYRSEEGMSKDSSRAVGTGGIEGGPWTWSDRRLPT